MSCTTASSSSSSSSSCDGNDNDDMVDARTGNDRHYPGCDEAAAVDVSRAFATPCASLHCVSDNDDDDDDGDKNDKNDNNVRRDGTRKGSLTDDEDKNDDDDDIVNIASCVDAVEVTETTTTSTTTTTTKNRRKRVRRRRRGGTDSNGDGDDDDDDDDEDDDGDEDDDDDEARQSVAVYELSHDARRLHAFPDYLGYKVVRYCATATGAGVFADVWALLHLQIPLRPHTRMYESEIAGRQVRILPPVDGMADAKKYCTSECHVIGVQFFGDAAAVKRTLLDFQRSRGHLVSAFAGGGNRMEYRLQRRHCEPRAGEAGEAGCSYGIHFFRDCRSALRYAGNYTAAASNARQWSPVVAKVLTKSRGLVVDLDYAPNDVAQRDSCMPMSAIAATAAAAARGQTSPSAYRDSAVLKVIAMARAKRAHMVQRRARHESATLAATSVP